MELPDPSACPANEPMRELIPPRKLDVGRWAGGGARAAGLSPLDLVRCLLSAEGPHDLVDEGALSVQLPGLLSPLFTQTISLLP